jgi:hypothetical protein
VGPRDGLEMVEKTEISNRVGNQSTIPVIQFITESYTYRNNYSRSHKFLNPCCVSPRYLVYLEVQTKPAKNLAATSKF